MTVLSLKTRAVIALVSIGAVSSIATGIPAAQAGIAAERANQTLGPPDTTVATTAAYNGQCPEVAIIAARGSEQNFATTPQRYAPNSPWESNGFEAENIAAGLHLAQQRHIAATGESLFHNVPVLALDEETYPADLYLPVIAERGSNPDALQFSSNLVEILRHTPPHTIAYEAMAGVVDSVRSGINNAPGFLEEFEQVTGCQPDYILFGYSQGSIVLSHLEKYLHDKDQLRGVVYIGNPQLGAGDPSTVGRPRVGNGLLAGSAVLPESLRPELPPVPRINYCMTDDFACDLSPQSAVAALRDEAGIHGDYFLIGNPHDAAVVDELAEWITHD